METILIGGTALRNLGSSRYTEDTDYLIFDPSQKEIFIHDTAANIDYVNAGAKAGNRQAIQFFGEIWKMEAKNIGKTASPQALLELKAYSLVQHCLNRNFQKADDAEYDMKFLIRSFKLKGVKTVKKYLSSGEMHEVQRIIEAVRQS